MYVFLDLDGTLIGPDGSVSGEVWAAIDRARERGHRLAVCTGRPRGGVSQAAARRVSPDGPHIFENGALIAPADGSPLRLETLHDDDLRRLVTRSESVRAVLELYTPNGIFVSKYNADCQNHERVLDIAVHQRNLWDVIATEDVVRAHWIMRAETIDEALADSDALVHSEVGVASSPVLPENIFASITRRGVSKGTAAGWVLENAAMTFADAAAIGDAPSDLSVLERVARPFVMGDAPDALRERFQTVPGVEDDGAATALDSLA